MARFLPLIHSIHDPPRTSFRYFDRVDLATKADHEDMRTLMHVGIIKLNMKGNDILVPRSLFRLIHVGFRSGAVRTLDSSLKSDDSDTSKGG